MTRDIKFRAWDKHNYVMSYPDDQMFTWYCGKQWLQLCAPYSNLEYQPFSTPAKPEEMILMQYTGMKDKNGKEIYEGDIVIDWSIANLSEQNYKDNGYPEGFNLLSYYRVIKIDPKFGISVSFEIATDYNELEVIGNIHENPELLTEESK